MSEERSKIKSLFARAKATREEVAPKTELTGTQGFEVPHCAHCGAPREVSTSGAVQGALAEICRFCKKPAGG